MQEACNIKKPLHILCCLFAAALLLFGCDNAIQITIVSPQDGTHFTLGETVAFSGTAFDSTEKELQGSSLVWTSNRDGQLAIGKSFSKSDLSAGNHTITLTASAANSGKGSASVQITVESGAVSSTTTTSQNTTTTAAAQTTTTTPVAAGLFTGTVILGRPTNSSITASILSPDTSGDVWLFYGLASGSYSGMTGMSSLQAGTPLEVPLDALSADTQYYYRVYFRKTGETTITATDEHSFHTARPAGSTFTFCIQGDSHPERTKKQFDADLYTRTLRTAASDHPDFYLTIGDDFSVDTLDPATVTAAQVTGRYTLQLPYLTLVGCSAPLFLVNGNHEQAARYLLDGTPDNVAVWAQNARNRYYPEPAPDSFYTGNTENIEYIGLLRNYFAWTWGDALFVTIDPYWASPACVDNPFYGGSKRTNLWDVTHGDSQYQWLKTTLEQSQAKYKFVFAHHVLGTGRGGIEEAAGYEWGGQNADGTWGFDTKRPGWKTPIHQLMAENNVTIFFQGHDHIWVKQELDGVIYQTLSEPADPNYSLFNSDAYTSGDKFSNTGYTRLTVSPDGIRVDYVRTFLPKDEKDGHVNGEVAYTYFVEPK